MVDLGVRCGLAPTTELLSVATDLTIIDGHEDLRLGFLRRSMDSVVAIEGEVVVV